MTTQQLIEKLTSDTWYRYKNEAERKGSTADEAFKDYFNRMLSEVAQSAREEAMREVMEKLPKPKPYDDTDHIFLARAFNICLDQVKQILTPQKDL